MRDLDWSELNYVSGAGDSPAPAACPSPTPKKRKGNNGFGNDGDANPAAPGNSGSTPDGKEGSLIR